MTIDDIEKIFEPYRNRYGFVSDNKLNRDHNPLFHGFYVYLLDVHGLLDSDEIQKQKDLLQPLIHPKYPGILLSAPYAYPNANKHSHDSLRAMFWLSKRLGMTFAEDFLRHGRTHKWNWNPDNPNLFDKAGTYERYTGMICQAMIAAGEDPPMMPNLWLNLELFISAQKTKGRRERITLPFFMCKTVEKENELFAAVVDYWRKRAIKKYPGGLGEVFETWSSAWTGHPYCELLRGHI